MIGFLWDYWHWILPGFSLAAAFVTISLLTNNWKWFLPVLGIAGAIFAVGRAHRRGAAYEREQLIKRNDAARRRAERDAAEAAKMSDDKLDQELGRWERR